jgi:hypothetical protein
MGGGEMNHSGDTNKMVSDTPRTDENTFRAYTSPDNSSRSCVSASFACQLERELNAAQQRIKRLEEARTKAAANGLANMLAYEDAEKKIAALIRAGEELAKMVRRDYRGAFCEEWEKAKEDKL